MIRLVTSWIRTARRLFRRATRHLILVRIQTTITQKPTVPGIVAAPADSSTSHDPAYCLACRYLPRYIKRQLTPGKSVSLTEFERLHKLISDYHNSYSRN